MSRGHMKDKSKYFICTVVITFIVVWPFLNYLGSYSGLVDVIETQVVEMADFEVSSSPVAMTVDAQELYISQGEGTKVFSTDVSLNEGDAFDVTFIAECAEEYEGMVINADLYGGAEYDKASGQMTIILRGGGTHVLVNCILVMTTRIPVNCAYIQLTI